MSIKFSKLGEQATIIMGQSPPGESYNKNGNGVPLLNGPTEFGSLHPIEKQWTTSPKKFCRPGDILFCVRGATAGRLNLADKEYCLGRGLAAIRGKSGKFDSIFLRYVLSNGYASFQARGVGSTFINISREELAAFEVPVLPLMEQRRIADILDRAEALRAKRRAALDQLDELIQSIFIDMFGDPIENPKGWHRQTLEKITKKITDGEHLNPQFSQSGMPIVMAGNVLEDLVDFRNSKTVENSLGDKFRQKCNPEIGDLLVVSRGATIGRLCVVNTNRIFCLMGSVILIKPHNESVDSRFLSTLLKHPVMQSALYKTSGSSAQQAIYLKDLKNLLCICPPLPFQHEFARFIETIEKLKATQRASLAELDELFTSLQYRAFRRNCN